MFFLNVFTQNIDFEASSSECLRNFLVIQDRSSEIMNGPEFELTSSYTVTRCRSRDELINSSNTQDGGVLVKINVKNS